MIPYRPPIAVMVGMPRAGSTTLYHHLRQHPAAALPFRKETFYFSFHHDRGVEWFLDLFRQSRPGQVGFDISPDYFYDSRTIDRILRFDPDTKALLAVREPVSWVLSLYNQRAGLDARMPSFREFLAGYQLRVGDKTLPLSLSPGFVTSRLQSLRDAFGDNILVYDYELLGRGPLRVLQAIEAFVGMPRHYDASNVSDVRLNASNRRHNRWLYALLNDERLISRLHRLLPEGLLARARAIYYRAAMRKSPSDPRARHSQEDVDLAEATFGGEREQIRRLFETEPLQLGSGTAFSAPRGESSPESPRQDEQPAEKPE